MTWQIVKKAFKFSLEINLTSTKLMAWVILILSFVIVDDLPEAGQVYYLSSVLAVVVFLYTGKNIQEYLKSKDEN